MRESERFNCKVKKQGLHGCHAVLVAGGTADPELIKEISRDVREGESPFLVGIDAGVLRIEEIGEIPDLVVGDFDSVDPDTGRRIRDTYPNRLILDPVKDDTDMEAAVRLMIRKGPVRVTILGATGGRLDHTLANLRLLQLFSDAGIPAALLDRQNRIRILTGPERIRISRKDQYGKYISLLPVKGDVEHLSLRGFKYDLEDGVLPLFSSLGVSNEIVNAEGEIEFPSGYLYLMETRDGIPGE